MHICGFCLFLLLFIHPSIICTGHSRFIHVVRLLYCNTTRRWRLVRFFPRRPKVILGSSSLLGDESPKRVRLTDRGKFVILRVKPVFSAATLWFRSWIASTTFNSTPLRRTVALESWMTRLRSTRPMQTPAANPRGFQSNLWKTSLSTILPAIVYCIPRI